MAQNPITPAASTGILKLVTDNLPKLVEELGISSTISDEITAKVQEIVDGASTTLASLVDGKLASVDGQLADVASRVEAEIAALFPGGEPASVQSLVGAILDKLVSAASAPPASGLAPVDPATHQIISHKDLAAVRRNWFLAGASILGSVMTILAYVLHLLGLAGK